MIIDILTNSERIVDFIKREEGFGGVIDEQSKNYVLKNVQIGFLDRFCESLDNYVRQEGINMENYGYRILDPRGNNVREKGNL